MQSKLSLLKDTKKSQLELPPEDLKPKKNGPNTKMPPLSILLNHTNMLIPFTTKMELNKLIMLETNHLKNYDFSKIKLIII
jgi:hypothetical protein